MCLSNTTLAKIHNLSIFHKDMIAKHYLRPETHFYLVNFIFSKQALKL
jgi:hypothetical protein